MSSAYSSPSLKFIQGLYQRESKSHIAPQFYAAFPIDVVVANDMDIAILDFRLKAGRVNCNPLKILSRNVSVS